MRRPTHPGEILREEFMKPLGYTQKSLAQKIGCDTKTIHDLVNEKIGVPDWLAYRLGEVFGTTDKLWINLHESFKLWENRDQ